MADRHLRKQLVRLAYAKPSLRPHLLPLLKKGNMNQDLTTLRDLAVQLKDWKQNPKPIIEISARYRDSKTWSSSGPIYDYIEEYFGLDPAQVQLFIPNLDLRGADLSGTDLRDAFISEANLQGADFSSADLRGCSLMGSNLRGANFRGANLGGTHFLGTDCTQADFRKALFSGTDFKGADISYAQFQDSTIRDNASLFFDHRTKGITTSDLTVAQLSLLRPLS